MSKLIDSLDLREIPLRSFLSMLSMRHPEHNLKMLQGLLDEEQQVSLLEKCAGNYWRAPTANSIDAVIADLELLSRYDAMRRATRYGDAEAVARAAQALQKAAKRANVASEAVKERVGQLREEIKAALLWAADLKAFAEKHPGYLSADDPEPVQDVPEPEPQAAPAPEPARHCEDCRTLVPQALGTATRCARCQPLPLPKSAVPKRNGLCSDCGKPTHRAPNALLCQPCANARKATYYKPVGARTETPPT